MKAADSTGKAGGDTLRLGLVGFGHWGSCYLSTLERIDGMEPGLVISRSLKNDARLPAGCALSVDWRDALEPGVIDGLILATPPGVQYEIACACVEAGLPLLMEKPMTLDPGQARDLDQRAVRSQTLVMVDHTHLFSSAYESLKERAHRLEGPLTLRSLGGNYGPFRRSANALWDWGPHDLAMCLDLAGAMPSNFHAAVIASRPAADGGGMTVSVHLEFADGTRAELEFGNLMKRKTRIFEARGHNGRLIYDDLGEDKLVFYDHTGTREAFHLPSIPPLTRVVKAFGEAIDSGVRQHPSLSLGVEVVVMLDRIEKAIEVGNGDYAGLQTGFAIPLQSI